MSENEQLRLLGYCIDKEGNYGDSIRIEDTDSFQNWLLSNIEISHELLITNLADETVFHCKDKVLIFPIPEFGTKNNKWDSEMKKFKQVESSTLGENNVS